MNGDRISLLKHLFFVKDNFLQAITQQGNVFIKII